MDFYGFMSTKASELPELSVVVPVKDESENLRPLIEEICASLDLSNINYEIIYVDDGSLDSTPALLRELSAQRPRLRVINHPSSLGQSAAIVTGVMAAYGRLIATIDGDGQNDPTDILVLLESYRNELDKNDFGSLMVVGHRMMRKDTWVKRWSSRIANSVRSHFLKDYTPDSGCGLKVFSQASFMELPRFNHMHRFLPALLIRSGGKVLSVPVNHRARERGVSKYGVWNRLWVGIIDLFGVMWLLRRSLPLIEEKKDPMR